MKVIPLPPVLPGDLNLSQINQQLRDRTAQLDWSAVVSAPEKQLTVLLAGLDLSDHADEVGINGAIADNIIAEISRFFKKQETKTKKRHSPSQPAPQTTPEVWTPVPSPVPPIQVPPILGKRGLGGEGIRAEFETAILNDLLGPVNGETEEIEESSVSDRYLIGLLAPLHRNKTPEEKPEQQDELTVADKGNTEEGTTEATIPPSETMFPSSFGMTFCVSGAAEQLQITAKWGTYKKEKSQLSFKEDGTPKQIWKRYPMQGVRIQNLIDGGEFDWTVLPDKYEVFVRGKTRRQDNGDWIVTLFLVNGQHEPKPYRDSAWLFQPQLTVRSADNHHPDIFIRKPLPRSGQNLDPIIHAENQAMAMLYRRQVEFAVGHGVSVHAETAPNTTERAVCLSTCVAPIYEVAKTTPPTAEEIPELAGLVLDMKDLSETNGETLAAKLTPLITAYQTWIETQEKRLSDPAAGLADYRDAAQRAIANCQCTLERICQGLTMLQSNKLATTAFQFMNRAMWQQRIQSIYAEKKRRDTVAGLAKNTREKQKTSQQNQPSLADIDQPKNRSWYPFQLAFILLNLPSLTDLHHPDRSHPTDAITDLLWFPTGGGKTEAYLGLTAYTIGLRRLQGQIGGRDGEHGVAVLMRYTLRLLTLQQFQRATALICACEAIRRNDEQTWGTEPIRIGLWVGQNSTPNYTSQSEEFTKQSRGQYQNHSGGSPHQLTNCPWCGSKIEPGKHIHVEPVEKGRGRTLIRCGDPLGRCPFSKGEGLPVLVVDEEIYRRLPALLIATVDKFAQMPWKGEVQMLFGQVNGYCQRHGFRSPDVDDKNRHNRTGNLPAAKTLPHPLLRPPDLIIQDELHLISGPLGTLVGLYETAIDQLSSWNVDGKRVRPKVVASTATIRQAQAQVHNLFLRKLHVFPPPGLDVEDNFFSKQRQPSPKTPGRRYLGICAPGRRLKAAIIRVYVASLAASQALYENYGEHADPWMTLVGYFNSLRELGGTRRLVEDDITSRLAKMDRRGLAKRLNITIDELTSRKDSTDIPVILDRLETPFNPQQQAETKARRKAGQKVEKLDPLDVILATNMISVGVDVKRLGVMVACGQPKNTAEYIQATSRVGRTHPGLVITVYNWARPRDLSHYERFAHYHATFYQNVEALSVTPFASGALYRGLTALFVSLVRQSGQDFNKNDSAGRIERDHPYIQAAIDAIVQRASLIEDVKIGEYVRQELETRLDKWKHKAENLLGGGILKYQADKRDGTTIELLDAAGSKEWQDFTCLNSLRNVEPTVGLILTDQPPDEDFSRLPQPMGMEMPEES
ncbi:DISARM system helicase DrmA [Coleofasciculus sp. F4-SAH-05]|uniref:DISARM system helicase DrmA n=1 Tax=Coleofasciculus sp. F4-SAH-05 TaxID=3069525 RepID=UPI0032F499C9